MSCNKVWTFDDNEPKCILSPRLLRIPNSSYKILGYIPDISGHGNHGVIHNSAYVEGSGVNEDGSYQFDDSGITVAKFSNGYTSMVFYKLILYPKTISLLEINFLKNLMEKDEIIDLNNPIFIKNE